ncbi:MULTISPECIES: protein YhfH [Paenibacillus]|jgi:predicted  nucleic acid-binding Zn-ribbon protein|uniref:YhfH family protein n=1 Tax=Paenibacillus oceani TaxID=2772510 RepID=A0A927CFU4_9BACL|nr:protein YhfH [Paenibacillus oceani]MBD2865181.1 YhfH family protein [Paenibacillus oceani]MDF2657702.1 YhfH-like protein [Paenibacillus sp.]
MLPSVNQFFDSLPKKQCAKCGTVMEEQSECYMHVCTECSGEKTYPLSFQPDSKKAI